MRKQTSRPLGRLWGSLATCFLAGISFLAQPTEAQAFCGFFVSGADADLYNNASQVALLRKGNRTVLSMSNNYKGPPQDFAMVVPVPVVLHKEQVKTLEPDVFRHVDQLSAPRLVEYWEQDPCRQEDRYLYKAKGGRMMAPAPMMAKKESTRDYGVTIEAKFAVGEYQILILSAKESNGLERFLVDNKYKIPKGAASALAPYIRDQMKFFVAKVDITKIKRDAHGLVVLSPLRFSYESQDLRLPVRLGLLNAESKQDLIIYVLHENKRFEVANYPNLFIPTNIEVADAVRQGFGSFYAELFDETLRRNNNRGVVTEYAWQTGSCDPCPTPPLTQQDLVILGLDEVSNTGQPLQIATPPNSGMPGAPPAPPQMRGRPFFGASSSWVLTRLHTRYDKATLSEDLIFREAQPVLGGRANGDGSIGDQGAQVMPQGTNNFQGRYIIRHYWEGPVACKNPRYGIWGGPNGSRSQGATAAQDLANAPRGKLSLSQVVQSPVPSLGLKGQKRPQRANDAK